MAAGRPGGEARSVQAKKEAEVLSRSEELLTQLARLCRESIAKFYEAGPVEHVDVALADGRQLACVKCGLYLIRDRTGPVVLLLSEDYYRQRGITAEVMAPDE